MSNNEMQEMAIKYINGEITSQEMTTYLINQRGDKNVKTKKFKIPIYELHTKKF